MTLVYVSQEPPYPPHRDGGRLIHYHYVKALARKLGRGLRYRYFHKPAEPSYLDRVRAELTDTAEACVMSSQQMKINLLRALVGWPPPLPAFLTDLPGDAVVVVDGVGLAWMARSLRGGVRCIHFPLDSFSRYYESLCTGAAPGPLKLKNWAMSRLAAWVERELFPDYDQILVVTDSDAERLRSCSLTTSVLPNGVDTTFFDPSRYPAHSVAMTVAFSGVMNYPPNVQAVQWFVRRIWPRVLRALPAARLLVIGREPADSIVRLSGTGNITVTGAVEEIQPWLQQATAVVAPMQSGAGIKNKILEALAMAKPVVTTMRGHEGIRRSPALIQADTEEEWTAGILRLLRDPAAARTLGEVGRELVKEAYSWDRSADRLLSIASVGRKACQGPPPTSARPAVPIDADRRNA